MIDFNYVVIPLFDAPFYDQSVTLESQSYILEFQYIERTELYTLTIYSSDRTLILAGVAVTPSYPIIRDYAIPGLTGYFMLVPKAVENNEAYKSFPDKINEYYDFYYVVEE